MRLDKFLSDATDMSRKDIKKLIKNKSVKVNGEVAKRPEMQVSETDEIELNGERIIYREFVYFIINKPQGVVSATEDRTYETVVDLVPEEFHHFGVFPVGRLDIDTEGLLILTNDGAFAHEIASPKKNVCKRYFAKLDKPLGEDDIEAFASSMTFKEFTAKPSRLEICDNPNEAFVEISEGKYHQVKRMFERIGKKVLYLKRVGIGGLGLADELKPGDIREVTKDELMESIF